MGSGPLLKTELSWVGVASNGKSVGYFGATVGIAKCLDPSFKCFVGAGSGSLGGRFFCYGGLLNQLG